MIKVFSCCALFENDSRLCVALLVLVHWTCVCVLYLYSKTFQSNERIEWGNMVVGNGMHTRKRHGVALQ